MNSSIKTVGSLSEEEISRWQELVLTRPECGAAFLSPEFVRRAAGIFHGVSVCVYRANGHPVAFFPFQFHSRFHRVFGIGERIAGELSDYFGIVAEPGFTIDPAALLRQAGLKALYFTHLDEEQTGFGLTGEAPEPGLRIEFPEGAAAYWEVRRKEDKKFTSDTDRRERKLVDKFGALRFVFREEDPIGGIERLIAAKRAQYTRTGARDSLEDEKSRDFLRALAGASDPACHGTLSTLHAGDTWVASHFGLVCGRTLHYWFPVYNPEVSEFAPGRLLVKAILGAGENYGVACIDRGSGDSAAKRDFATSKHFFRRGLWARRGPTSLLYRAGLSARWRLARAGRS